MDDFFLGVVLTSIIGIIVSVIKPSLILDKSRSYNILLFFTILVASFIAFGITQTDTSNAFIGLLGIMIVPVVIIFRLLKSVNINKNIKNETHFTSRSYDEDNDEYFYNKANFKGENLMNIQENQQDKTMPIYLTVPAIVILAFISIPAPRLILGVIVLVILRNKELKKLDEKNKAFNQFLKNQQNQLREDYNHLLEKQDFVDEILSKKDEIEKETDLYAQQFESTKQNMQREIDKYRNKLESVKEEIFFEYIETDQYEDLTSEEAGNELSILRLEQKDLIKDNKALDINIDDTKSYINNLSKKILRSFNSESDQIILKVTEKNIETSRNRLVKSFEQINKLYDKNGIQITMDYLNSKLEEMTLVYNFELKKDQEREIQRAIKEQMVEEEKVRKEVDNEKKKIEKEEKQFKGEVDKLMKYLQKTDNDIEKKLYDDKIRELQEKIGLLEKDKENVLQREQNTRAGFVYIISNVGSFGENIYKIGMTRRLEPMDRIKELSSASVPFSFDVHAMIFSEDAPTLENDLHKAFKDYEVNKVNPRKEFFNINLDKIESVVKEKYSNTVEFIKSPKTSEYLESLNAEKTTD